MNRILNFEPGRKLLLPAIFLIGMSPTLSGHVNAPIYSDSFGLATYCPDDRSPANSGWARNAAA